MRCEECPCCEHWQMVVFDLWTVNMQVKTDEGRAWACVDCGSLNRPKFKNMKYLPIWVCVFFFSNLFSLNRYADANMERIRMANPYSISLLRET